MASTYTTRIGLEKQADGENANTWGLRLNTNVIDLVDEATAGYEAIDISGGATTLTATDGASNQARNMGLRFTGALSADTTVTIPAEEKIYFVTNDTTENFKVLLKPAGGTLVTVVNQGKNMMAATDGSIVKIIEGVGGAISATDATFSGIVSATNIVATSIVSTRISATTIFAGSSFGTAQASATTLFSTSAVINSSGTSATQLTLINENNTGVGGPNLRLYRDSTSPAVNDKLGSIYFTANTSSGSEEPIGYIQGKITTMPSATRIIGDIGFWMVQSDSTIDNVLRINANSLNIGKNTSITGDLNVTGTITEGSDERYKSNIQTLDGTKAFDMRGVSFEKNSVNDSGVIAQELELVAPELVTTDEEGYKSVAYSHVIGYLIEAVKHLKEEVETLKGNN
tara:strand:- start:2871 stop:4070 length:1200 start_codon:yes stop_codon:yes gene_type:complete